MQIPGNMSGETLVNPDDSRKKRSEAAGLNASTKNEDAI